MESKANSSMKDNRSIRYYCQSCKKYISSEAYVTEHLDHEITDLAEKSTRFLAEYQKLSRTASLLSDRRQVHIKDESIQKIMSEIRNQVIEAKINLQKDIGKTVDANANYLLTNPVVQEMSRVKADLAGKDDEELTKVKDELCKFCKDLLIEISESHYESADKLIDPAKLKEYEEKLKKISEKAASDVDFIQEIRKLKQTKVEYCYDPLATLGMIRIESEVKKPGRVMQFDREKNVVNIYNVETKKTSTVEVSVGFVLPYRFVSIEAYNGVYLNGGDNDHKVYLKSHYLYDEFRGGLVPLAALNVARSRHALVSVESKRRIYAIGGENAKGVLSHCEYFDVKTNQWLDGPELHEERCGLSACTLEASIYVIGGWNQDYLSSIEKLNTSDDSNKWEVIKLSKKSSLKSAQVIGTIGIKSDEILIFGGYHEKEVLTKECYILNVDSLALSKKEDMREPEAFISSEVRKIGDTVYAFGYVMGGVHFYNTTNDSWGFVPQSEVVAP